MFHFEKKMEQVKNNKKNVFVYVLERDGEIERLPSIIS